MTDAATPVSVTTGRRVAFVAHCLVNQNAKVQEFARSPGVVPGVIERLRRHGYRIQQLPCPEMAFAGVNRWWQGRELYDKANYRRHCQILAANMAEPIAEFYRRGFEIVVIGLDGSPSSGVRYTGKAKDWGGRPHFEDGDYEVVEGMGVWMEELKLGLEARGTPWPRASGMLLDTTDWDEARDLPACLDELDEFLAVVAVLHPDPRAYRVAVLADGVANEGAALFDVLGSLAAADFGVIVLPPSDFAISTIASIVEYVVDDLVDYDRNGYRVVVVGSSALPQFGVWNDLLAAELTRRSMTPFEEFDVDGADLASFETFLLARDPAAIATNP